MLTAQIHFFEVRAQLMRGKEILYREMPRSGVRAYHDKLEQIQLKRRYADKSNRPKPTNLMHRLPAQAQLLG